MTHTSNVQITFRDAVMSALAQQMVDHPAVAGNEAKFAADLFHQWFTKYGNANFFLFKKNLRITNMQFPELLALIRSEVQSSDGAIMGDIQFVSPNEFDRMVGEIAGALGHLTADRFADALSALYAPLLERMIVIRAFYSSAVAFLPPHMTLDLARIAGFAGYIHSCGPAAYVRRMDKANPEEFKRAIRRHLDAAVGPGQKLMFEPFSHEDHTKHDREWEADLRSGLDDVKLHVEKLFIGEKRLVSFLAELDQDEDRIVIPPPGPFRQTESVARSEAGVLKDRTLWLIGDKSINQESSQTFPGEHRYFICYEQKYRNEHPFHLFDENKPAWTAPITIPHTLAGAMINLTRPTWTDRPEVTFCDPFVGSGTVWLEALKYSALRPTCSDWSEISPLLCDDNLNFFDVDDKKLSELQQRLENLAERIETDGTGASRQQREDYRSYEAAKRRFEPLAGPALENVQDDTFTKEVVTSLEALPHRFDRLMFYLVVRTSVRNASAYIRRSAVSRTGLFDPGWQNAFVGEVRDLALGLEHMLTLRGRESDGGTETGDLKQFPGQYSTSCYAIARRQRGAESPTLIRDARTLPAKAFDVIVTDPPYGFNTEERPEDLAALYASFIPSLVRALTDTGQLVLCLPDQSFNGRRMFFFTRKDLVVQQVLRAAEDFDFNVVVPSYAVPAPSHLFKPPYYWESERALRRAILHFRFQRRPASPETIVHTGDANNSEPVSQSE